MDLAQIAVLLKPYVELTGTQLEQTSRYLDLLLKWNARINLTAVRRPEEIVPRHFGESYFAASVLRQNDGGQVIDLGSGAGFPGLPLAIFWPKAQVTLIEANARKAVFLNEVIGDLNLKNARVFSQRAEIYSETADAVILRAVEKFEQSLPVAVGLVRTGGRVALMIGASQMENIQDRGVAWGDPVPIPESDSRVLVVGTKIVKVE